MTRRIKTRIPETFPRTGTRRETYIGKRGNKKRKNAKLCLGFLILYKIRKPKIVKLVRMKRIFSIKHYENYELINGMLFNFMKVVYCFRNIAEPHISGSSIIFSRLSYRNSFNARLQAEFDSGLL